MFKVDAPVRMSTPGHSILGVSGVGECGWVTPGVALEKKLAKRLPNEGDVSGDPTPPDGDEQPDNNPAPTIRTAARRRPRLRSSSCPGSIGITRLFRPRPRSGRLYQRNRGGPKAAQRVG